MLPLNIDTMMRIAVNGVNGYKSYAVFRRGRGRLSRQQQIPSHSICQSSQLQPSKTA